MIFPFKKSHIVSRTTRRNQAQQQYEKAMADHRAAGRTPEQIQQRAETDRRQFIDDNYDIIQSTEREKAMQLATKEGILEPQKSDFKKCAPALQDLGINTAIGAGFGGAAGSAVGPIGTAVGAGFGAAAAACTQMYNDHKQMQQCMKTATNAYEKEYAEYENHLKKLNPDYGASKEVLFSQNFYQYRQPSSPPIASENSSAKPTGMIYTDGKTHGFRLGVRY